MSEAKLPLAYRDSCAGLLIPLNKCRHDTFFAIWKCEVSSLAIPSPQKKAQEKGNEIEMNWANLTTRHEQQNERHAYEKCQYEEFKKRVAKMDELRAAKASESTATA